MLIDHIGLGIWYRLPELGYLVPESMDRETWWSIYRMMRNIGRTAFPIFCFLLVEGFFQTRNHYKYALRLFVFALISQLPFKYAFLSLADGLNIFFTLLIGLTTMWVMNEIKIKWTKQFIYLPLWFIITFIAGYIAHFLNTDYDYKGVLLIIILFIFHKTRIVALTSSYFSFKLAMFYSSSFVGGFLKYLGADYYFPGFIVSYFYNGNRGLQFKYLFYFVYPLHLALIYVLWYYLL